MNISTLDRLYMERDEYKRRYKATKNITTKAILRGKIQGITFAIELLN